jgi:hypothetical protein
VIVKALRLRLLVEMATPMLLFMVIPVDVVIDAPMDVAPGLVPA